MEQLIRQKYRFDSAVILFCIAFSWVALLLVLKAVYDLSPTPMIKAVAVLSCFTVGIFSTCSLVAVLVHLKKDPAGIYFEDIVNQRKLQDRCTC